MGAMNVTDPAPATGMIPVQGPAPGSAPVAGSPVPPPVPAPVAGPPVPAPLPGQAPGRPGAYHMALAGERRRVWRGILALVLLMGGMLAGAVLFGVIGVAVEGLLGRSEQVLAGRITPVTLAAGMVALALLTPWSMLLQRWLYGVPARSLHSLRERLRLDLLARAALVSLPIWTVYMAVITLLPGVNRVEWAVADLIACLVVTVVLVPLQAAGEEYAFRGLALRIGASWGAGPRSGLVIGLLVSSLLFTLVHFAADPWLNLYYFVFGVCLGVIAWRSGGLEIPIVLHAVNNVLAFLYVIVLHMDLNAGFDRSAGVGSPLLLLSCAIFVAAAGIVWLRTRRPATAGLPAAGQ